MREKELFNPIFVMPYLQVMWHQFMKERRILGVTLVMLAFQKNGWNTHMVTVHEGKKPFECNICDASFALKHHMKGHIASVDKGKKPFECNIN
jgi:hypothetical protein